LSIELTTPIQYLWPVPQWILVADDDIDIREAVTEALELSGYQVVAVENGKSALEKLDAGLRPALILLDLMMPVMDGLSLLQTLRARPELAPLPVIVFTAAQGKAPAGVPFLHKPFNLMDLIAQVASHARVEATS
jgi:CheY-like chemotaxis protein